MTSGNLKSERLQVMAAKPRDLLRYIALLEDVAAWLEERGIAQWRVGSFRESVDYFAESIKSQEVMLAFLRDELVGTLRVLLREPVVWPEIVEDDAVYIYTLAVARRWADQQFGRRLLEWAANYAVSMGRSYVRLDCVVDNQFLRRYYQQAGFVDCGEIDARYPEPIGTLRLQRYQQRVHVRVEK